MIPARIMLTYKTQADVPTFVFKNLTRLNPNKEIVFFSDEDAIVFLEKNFPASYVAFFLAEKIGCIKADFFRYCYLWHFGGYYTDVDIEHIAAVDSYVSPTTSFFSVISVQMLQYHYKPGTHRSMFQALLYATPRHPIIGNCIADIMSKESAVDPFKYATLDMYKNTAKYICASHNKEPGCDDFGPGCYAVQPAPEIVQLAEERYESATNRYACYVGDTPIAFSRYKNYTRAGGFQ